MSARRSPHAPWRRIFSPPETRLGWWAVGLAATFVIFLILGYGGLAVPAYGVVLLLCGLCGRAVGLIAVVRFVWLTMVPGLVALVFLINEFLRVW